MPAQTTPISTRALKARKLALKALLAAGYSPKTASKALKMSELDTTLAIRKRNPPDLETTASVKKGVARKLYQRLDHCIDAITDKKIMDSTAYQLSGMIGLLLQNARLAEGESTSNVAIVNWIVEASRLNEKKE